MGQSKSHIWLEDWTKPENTAVSASDFGLRSPQNNSRAAPATNTRVSTTQAAIQRSGKVEPTSPGGHWGQGELGGSTRMSESLLWACSCSQGGSQAPLSMGFQQRLGVKSEMNPITLNGQYFFPTPKQTHGASQVVLVVKNPPVTAGNSRNKAQSLGQANPLEKQQAIHYNILAWEIPWTEEPGGLQSIESQRVRHN